MLVYTGEEGQKEHRTTIQDLLKRSKDRGQQQNMNNKNTKTLKEGQKGQRSTKHLKRRQGKDTELKIRTLFMYSGYRYLS